jgi:uncharacterized membrane protein YcaP (DUF421 family)
MYLLQANAHYVFNWHRLLLGEEDWYFLAEVALRSIVMFAVTLATMRIIGKRGIMQGVFEIALIITLGSAAGDPMFYSKVGLLPAILVFLMVIVLYKVVNYFIARYKILERAIEGKPMKLITDGKFEIENFNKGSMSKYEFFSDLRLRNVSQLGQVRIAYVEASGKISVIFFEDKAIRYGLPITPEELLQIHTTIKKEAIYSCSWCGHTLLLQPSTDPACPVCSKKLWVVSSNERRIL